MALNPPRRGPDHASAIGDIPKVDLHLHAETFARLDRLRAVRTGAEPYDWSRWLTALSKMPAGMPRLRQMSGELPIDELDRMDADDETFVSRVEDVLAGAAAEGAVLAEVRFGAGTVLRPRFMALFREAESRARSRNPGFYAEAIISGIWPSREIGARALDACIRAREEGLAGIDLLPEPYETEAEWTEAYRWAERAAAAGLGITAHAGEFSEANVAAALATPGLTRIGHATHAAWSEDLMERLAVSGVTVECCISSNVVLGAVASPEDHPIRRLADRGVRVTVNTDNPVRLRTTIGREYALAAQLGFSGSDLLLLSRNAVDASFTSSERRSALRAHLRIDHGDGDGDSVLAEPGRS